MEEKEVVSKNFIELAIDKDLAEGVYDHVCTRFPPEPNGYLHIGHAKSILLNYGLSQEYNGEFHMRFDDTNPTKEKTEFVDSIKADIQWLGADWKDHLYYASDYFPQMYEAAVKLIKKGKAFVCDLSAEEIREYRGTLTEPGKESPYRNRSVEENLDLFERMKNGEFEDGSKVLRAKIDMASPNINMRDPVIYRVAHMHHHRTGDTWCIYPMYDFAHPIEDAIEGITHSICTLEFEDHRPLYDWVVRELEYPMPPRQIEFAKLYLTNVVTGKRYIKKLVEDGVVDGWDDPRLVSRVAHMHHHRTGDTWCIYPMYDFAHPIEDAIEGITHSICTLEFEDHRPLYDWVVRELEYPMPPRQIEFAKLYLTNVVTGKRYIKKLVEDGVVDGWDDPRLVSIAALRRRGFTPESIKKFVDLCGVSKANSSVDYAMLEYCIREDLKLKKARTMAVLNPVKLVIDNYPEDQIEMLEVQNNLENPELGSRQVPFGRELYIEREDFMEEPVRKYFRMFPGNEVRLMNAYFVTCTGCEKDENGNITVIHGTYDPESKGGNSPDGRKVKGTIHWVAAKTAVKAECRLYENLIDEEKGVYNEDGSMNLNPNSLTVLKECYLEPSLKDAKAYDSFQFVRNGFFCVDAKDSKEDALVFNRIVSLKSSFKLPAAK